MLRTPKRNELIQYLSPYVPVKELAGIVHDYLGDPFISTWQVGGDYGLKIFLPLDCDGKYNFIIDWGDGTSDQITSFYQAESSHKYQEAGRYVVQLSGVVNGFAFNYKDEYYGNPVARPSRKHILDISQWGCVGLSPQGYQFMKCVNLNCSAHSGEDIYVDVHASVHDSDELEGQYDRMWRTAEGLEHWKLEVDERMKAGWTTQ